MVSANLSKTFARRVYLVSFIALLLPIVALVAWLSIAALASGSHPPRVVTLRLELLAGMILFALLYFKWPWIAVIVSWTIMTMIISHILPWDESGLENFFYQFGFDLLFFLGANAGFIAFVADKGSGRTEN